MIETNFEEIYKQNKGLVYRLALSYVRNVEEAEDITQNVFVKVHEKLDQFKGDAHIQTWIYRITGTTSLDHIKSKKTKKRFGNVFSLMKDNGETLELKDDTPHAGAKLENQELSDTLMDAINELSEPQRTAFYLSHVDGLGNIEISEILEKSVGAVESMVQRAKAGLRKNLESFYDEYRRNTD
jgi:RNA polymerase sigma-70 factor (ECF subfamily)